MGPRLLRNFTRDRGNQVTLGIFLGTFAYALMVLRTVRSRDEAHSCRISASPRRRCLAFVCVGTLVWFVHHVATAHQRRHRHRPGHADLGATPSPRYRDEPPAPAPGAAGRGAPVPDARRGYLQQLDEDGLADWAAEQAPPVLLVRPATTCSPARRVALVEPAADGAERGGLRAAHRARRPAAAAQDLEFAVRQLVEVAVRALSPGINDPHTAIASLDRLGAALCELAPRTCRPGVVRGDGRAALVGHVDYAGLVDAMFHMIRQNAAGGRRC